MANTQDVHIRDSVSKALAEFVQTDFVIQTAQYCQLNPAEYGKVSGVFEALRLVDTKLYIKLTIPFTQKSDALLDRLAEHLRARVPQLERLDYSINGGWGNTRTWIL